jgi:hypothetical protein
MSGVDLLASIVAENNDVSLDTSPGPENTAGTSAAASTSSKPTSTFRSSRLQEREGRGAVRKSYRSFYAESSEDDTKPPKSAPKKARQSPAGDTKQTAKRKTPTKSASNVEVKREPVDDDRTEPDSIVADDDDDSDDANNDATADAAELHDEGNVRFHVRLARSRNGSDFVSLCAATASTATGGGGGDGRGKRKRTKKIFFGEETIQDDDNNNDEEYVGDDGGVDGGDSKRRQSKKKRKRDGSSGDLAPIIFDEGGIDKFRCPVEGCLKISNSMPAYKYHLTTHKRPPKPVLSSEDKSISTNAQKSLPLVFSINCATDARVTVCEIIRGRAAEISRIVVDNAFRYLCPVPGCDAQFHHRPETIHHLKSAHNNNNNYNNNNSASASTNNNNDIEKIADSDDDNDRHLDHNDNDSNNNEPTMDVANTDTTTNATATTSIVDAATLSTNDGDGDATAMEESATVPSSASLALLTPQPPTASGTTTAPPSSASLAVSSAPFTSLLFNSLTAPTSSSASTRPASSAATKTTSTTTNSAMFDVNLPTSTDALSATTTSTTSTTTVTKKVNHSVLFCALLF